MSLLYLTSACCSISTASEGPGLWRQSTELMYTTTSQLTYSCLSTIYAAPQALDAECIFITASMHIHGGVDGAGGGTCTSSRRGAECRSRRRMLIQLHGSCSLVPMATVFALEQESCISSLAIKDQSQAGEWGLSVTKSHQHRCKGSFMPPLIRHTCKMRN